MYTYDEQKKQKAQQQQFHPIEAPSHINSFLLRANY